MEEDLVEGREDLFFGVELCVVWVCGLEVPERLDGGFGVFEYEEVTSGQAVEVMEDGIGARDVVVCEVLREGEGVNLFFEVWVLEDSFNFRGEDDLILDEGIVERFFAGGVTSEEEGLFFLIPESKGEHAIEFGEELGDGLILVFLIEVDNDFRVGLGLGRNGHFGGVLF